MKLVRMAMIGAALATALVGCGGDSQGEIDVAITRPAAGATVGGNVVDLDVSATGIEIVAADGNTSGRSGHYHVFIDADPVRAGEPIPTGPGIVHSADDPIRIAGLTRGRHTLTVVLGDGTHRRIGDASASVEVDIAGPSLTATAPATVPEGRPVEIQLATDGLTIVPADGDTSGRTGHFHVFVDKDPVQAGEAVPTGDPQIIHSASSTVSVPDLAAGEHVFWIVAGDGTHVALDPPVMAQVKVTVV